MKIVLAVPSGTMVHASFAMCFGAMCKSTPKEHGLAFLNVKSSNIALSRNRAVAQAQEDGADYMLFLDSDMSFPPDALTRLMRAMQEKEAAIVGCTYVMRQPPFRNLAYGLPNEAGEQTVKGVVEVARLPTGLMLIDLKIFLKLKQPYFRFPFQEEDLEKGVEPSLGGEDYYFCDSVVAAGGHIWMDTDLSYEITHWGEMGVQWANNEKGYVTIVNS
jgi:glycosyltransferase involved in cell wall biosynthesis